MPAARPWLVAVSLSSSLLLAPGAGRAAAPAPAPTPEPAPAVPPDANRVAAFLNSGAYRTWPKDKEVRCIVGHDTWGRVFYSPDVLAWLEAGRPPEGLGDGALIVKEMYADQAGTKITGWAFMDKYKAGSFDGWFWGGAAPGQAQGSGQYALFPCVSCHASADTRELTFADLGHIDGSVHEDDRWCRQQSDPAVTAAAPEALRRRPAGPRLAHGALPEPQPTALPTPRPQPDPAFTGFYPAPGPSPLPTPPGFPTASAQPWAVAGPTGPAPFVVSGNCQGCHDGGRWLVLPQGVSQNMVVEMREETLNVSPFAEWSASLMGLSGRDPVFHAQLESEKALRPQMAGFLDDTCYRCHGVMGQRQIALDRQQGFQHFMVYAQPGDPSFPYGALARDGVSCTACHHVAAEGLGTPETFTGQFQVGPSNEVYGPFSDDVRTRPMRNALGITPRGAAHVTSSALCGSCHVVVLPQVPSETAGRPVPDGPFATEHEQTTYLEWLYSAFQNERPPVDPARARTCQDCHMPRTAPAGAGTGALTSAIANVEDYRFPNPQPPHLLPRADLDLLQRPYSRHTLVALNLTGMQLFQQFFALLGVPPADTTSSGAYAGQPATTSNLLLAARESERLAREQTARVEILSAASSGARVDVRVRVSNLAGHKLPSGVGFRRAWLELRAVDRSGRATWTSGATDGLGVILGPDGQPLASELSSDPRVLQPHYERIDREDQVQIYEERTLDDLGRLTSTFLGRFREVKDNRLLPAGWPRDQAGVPEFLQPQLPLPEGNGSSGQFYRDPRYDDGSGSDVLVYSLPAERVPAGARLEATLFYQSLPPYYLRDRFATASGVETQRLYWMASRLSLEGSPVTGWKLRVAGAVSAVGGLEGAPEGLASR